MVDVLLGLQWGDEGKGKIVDYLAGQYDIIARFQGGPNAGHTLYINGEKTVLHTIPSGIFHDHCLNLIGNGVVLDPVTFKKECDKITAAGINLSERLLISNKVHLILPTHRALDKASEMAKGNEKIGSTLKGIGPAYMDKTGRNALRVGDILEADFMTRYEKIKAKHAQLLDMYQFTEDISEWEQEFFTNIEFLKTMNIISGEYWINEQLRQGKKILAEGAQGSMLDVDFGTYPFVTSSNTITAGVCTGLGIAPHHIKEVIGISKAYCTRVGGGPFPTELLDETGEKLRKLGNEFGATTGRPRRCGWIDLVALNYACMLNGVTQLCLTKADVMDGFDAIEVCDMYKVDGKETDQIPYDLCTANVEPMYKTFKGWDKKISDCTEINELPDTFNTYISFLEETLKVNIRYISNGVGRNQLLTRI